MAAAETGALIGQAWQYDFMPPVVNDGARVLSEPQLRMVLDGGKMETGREKAKRIGREIPSAPEDLPEPVLSPNGAKVLAKRYLAKAEAGKSAETGRDLFWRVAWNIASAEVCWGASQVEIVSRARDYYEMMANLDFLPNSPTLMNAGRGLQQLSGCFVLPIEDSMQSIMDGAKAAALIHQSGGGTGFSFSRLRPNGDLVAKSGGEASGPVSFAEIFDKATDVIKQGGKRRGANMGCLSVHHPDIMEFIRAKLTPGRLTNFNLSVLLTDDFMRAVQEDGEYDQVNPHTLAHKRVKAREVFNEIVQSAWASGEPGIIFIDAINKTNPTSHLGLIESTNPCGEQPLHPYESCNLGSINVARMVRNGQLNEDRLRATARQAVRLMDDVIEMNQYPLPEIEAMTLANRRIGLGIMGLADMLIQMGLAYDSDEGLEAAGQVMRIIQEEGCAESARLAQERGVFPNWKESKHGTDGKPMRNATITTIAPTGSIGMIAGCSQGCEPYFGLSFQRKGLLDGKTDFAEDLNPLFLAAAKRAGLSDEVLRRIAETGRARGIEGIPEWLQKLFPTAHDVSVGAHIRMQAALQRWTDNAVSKTINMPHSATTEDVARAYMLAYKLGCKGVTIYRDGSRDTQVIEVGKPAEPQAVAGQVVYDRPVDLDGRTSKRKVGCGRKLYITMNSEGGELVEVIVGAGKSGACTASQLEAMGRLISIALQYKAPLSEVLKQLEGIRCPSPGWSEGSSMLSCADAVAKTIKRYLGIDHGHLSEPSVLEDPPGDEPQPKNILDLGHNPECPECGSVLQLGEGCANCPSCGFSHCG